YSVPKVLEVHPYLCDEPMAIFGSKATGEPPLMYGLGVYFAIRNAVCAFNKNCSPTYSAPFTPEKVLMNLYAPIKPSSVKNESSIASLEINQQKS
ncbi:MAG: xanthine dehydrogenase, partial [Ginsengibacter sp.]